MKKVKFFAVAAVLFGCTMFANTAQAQLQLQPKTKIAFVNFDEVVQAIPEYTTVIQQHSALTDKINRLANEINQLEKEIQREYEIYRNNSTNYYDSPLPKLYDKKQHLEHSRDVSLYEKETLEDELIESVRKKVRQAGQDNNFAVVFDFLYRAPLYPDATQFVIHKLTNSAQPAPVINFGQQKIGYISMSDFSAIFEPVQEEFSNKWRKYEEEYTNASQSRKETLKQEASSLQEEYGQRMQALQQRILQPVLEIGKSDGYTFILDGNTTDAAIIKNATNIAEQVKQKIGF
jgi:Skp family chaperone for outer membrane proteins